MANIERYASALRALDLAAGRVQGAMPDSGTARDNTRERASLMDALGYLSFAKDEIDALIDENTARIVTKP